MSWTDVKWEADANDAEEDGLIAALFDNPKSNALSRTFADGDDRPAGSVSNDLTASSKKRKRKRKRDDSSRADEQQGERVAGDGPGQASNEVKTESSKKRKRVKKRDDSARADKQRDEEGVIDDDDDDDGPVCSVSNNVKAVSSKKNKGMKKCIDSANTDDQREERVIAQVPEVLARERQVLPKKGKMTLQEKLRNQLDSGRFRYVNEQLYTSTSNEAVSLFRKEPKLFDIYHDGFATQVSKWPVNPVDQIISWLQKKSSTLVVADLGCGEAKLARTVKQRVHSFDLVAANDSVTACDMAHVPLPKASVDIAVFSLSLMGTNLSDFVKEARRILRPNGMLKVAEVKSRIEDTDDFCLAVCEHGFELTARDEGNRMFIDVEFVKTAAPGTPHSELVLKPCLYKRR